MPKLDQLQQVFEAINRAGEVRINEFQDCGKTRLTEIALGSFVFVSEQKGPLLTQTLRDGDASPSVIRYRGVPQAGAHEQDAAATDGLVSRASRAVGLARPVPN